MITHYNGRPDSNEGRSEVEIRTYDFLDSLGIQYETVCHEAAFTMEQCQEIEKTLGVPICKNLFLCNRQQTQFYLLMLPGDKHFKTKFLSSELGCARLSFADESKMTELLGIHPGSVSVMGLINDKELKVMLVIDNDLMKSEYLGCHPCINTATLKIKMTDLLEKSNSAATRTRSLKPSLPLTSMLLSKEAGPMRMRSHLISAVRQGVRQCRPGFPK